MKSTFSLLFALPFVFWSCEKGVGEDALLSTLFHKEKDLNCRLSSMKDSISTEWDHINQLLESGLPADTPEEEKKNMLKVRNAGLIRMFQSYDGMEEEVKVALEQTEQLDMEMSKRITALKKEIQRIESQRIELFQKVEQKEGPQKVDHYRAVYQSVQSAACN